MHREIAAGLKDREVFLGETSAGKGIYLSIFNAFCLCSGSLMSLQIGKGGVAVGSLVGVHMSQIRVVLGINGRRVHLLTLCTRVG